MISGERLQDQWSSGLFCLLHNNLLCHFLPFMGASRDMRASLDEFEFLQICNRVTALDLRQNLVFAQ